MVGIEVASAIDRRMSAGLHNPDHRALSPTAELIGTDGRAWALEVRPNGNSHHVQPATSLLSASYIYGLPLPFHAPSNLAILP